MHVYEHTQICIIGFLSSNQDSPQRVHREAFLSTAAICFGMWYKSNSELYHRPVIQIHPEVYRRPVIQIRSGSVSPSCDTKSLRNVSPLCDTKPTRNCITVLLFIALHITRRYLYSASYIYIPRHRGVIGHSQLFKSIQTQMAGSGELTIRINTMDWKVIDRTYRNWEALRFRSCYVSNGRHVDFAMFQTHLWLALLCFKIVRSNICMCTNIPKLVSSGLHQAIKIPHSEFIARPFFPQLQFALVGIAGSYVRNWHSREPWQRTMDAPNMNWEAIVFQGWHQILFNRSWNILPNESCLVGAGARQLFWCTGLVNYFGW